MSVLLFQVSDCCLCILPLCFFFFYLFLFFFKAEDGIRDLVRSRGLGDVYKRQLLGIAVRKNGEDVLDEED